MKLETLMKCHMNAFAYFNGLPEQILYDNIEIVVTKHTPVEIHFNRTFEDFLAYYGIVPKTCKPHVDLKSNFTLFARFFFTLLKKVLLRFFIR